MSIYTSLLSTHTPTPHTLALDNHSHLSLHAPVRPGERRGWPRVAGPRRGWSCRPDHAVAVAVWWPHPPIRPGAAGVSPSRPARPPGLPDPAGIRRFRKGVHRPMFPSDSPSGEASFPLVGGEPRLSPPPRWRRGPLGVESPRVSRSALSQATFGGRFVHHAGYGAPYAAIPVLLRQSPPLPRHGFHWPLAGRCRLLCRELLPMANVASSSLPPELGGHAERLPR